MPGRDGVGEDPGDHERSEEIALAAFVHSDVWGEHFGLVQFFITEPGFSEDPWLESEADEILRLLALDQGLGPFLVNRDGEFSAAGGEERVRFRLEFVAVFLKHFTKARRLSCRQDGGMGGFCHEKFPT